jgi:2-dehydro-3-deoxyphosphogluconate aldolase/(4S)-4-hydroxy-2-oxoglutarate aldolase
MESVLEQIAKIGIVPVIKIDRVEDAAPLAKALSEGGLRCAEITFRTAAAEDSIRAIVKALPDMLVGAGTVLTLDQLEKAAGAGAKFIVTPGFNPRIVEAAIKKGIPITPGCSSASDIEKALEFGLDVVKFFPAEASGGLKAIKALAGPYPNVKFMPTGGINAANLGEYLAFDKILACGGSWMVDPALIDARDFAGITKLTREAVRSMLDFAVIHVGINCADEKEADSVAKLFGLAFGFEYKGGNASIFAGKGVEIMKAPGLGAKGHIAIAVNSTERAIAYLESRGWKFRQETAKTDAKGRRIVIYLEENFGGFAVHLVQR